MTRSRLSLAEVFGLSPLPRRLREAALSLRGDSHTPKVQYDTTSLRQFFRLPGPLLWAGHKPGGRLCPIYNLFSYAQPPAEEGWSTRITTARDFMGGQLTYDSHNATDFAVPVGTTVVAAAPGVVRRISSEFNRGGLKIFIDHGEGLITTSNHLGRALVREGESVRRGQAIALSAYSGIDGLATFPFGVPHVHFNVWLNGAYVDPFAAPGETALWRTGNWPTPHAGSADEEPMLAPTAWDEGAMARALASCVHGASRHEIEAQDNVDARAFALLFHMNYYPTRFAVRPSLYREVFARRPRLDLPLSSRDYDGVSFPGPNAPPR